MKIVFCTGSLETIPSNPQKSNLPLLFIRTARIRRKQKQTQGHKLYSKVLTIKVSVVYAKILIISLTSMLIQTTDQLRAIYKAPSQRAVLKELTHIDTHLKRFISLSPFLVISSGDQLHQMDCSPRGGDAGFVKVLDQQTLLIPDSIGNNRLDTLTNIIATSQVGLLFFIPGIDEVVRVNGSATLQTDSDLLKHFDTLKNNPKLVIKVIVEAAYMHCPKAMMRSKLWSIEHHQNIDAMPTIGQIISDQTKSEGPVESREEMLKRYTPDL
jgi:PPOX class probable FMN-dependent enzyme